MKNSASVRKWGYEKKLKELWQWIEKKEKEAKLGKILSRKRDTIREE